MESAKNAAISAEKNMEKGTLSGKISAKRMAFIAIMAAVICVASPFSIPIGPIPISLANLVIWTAVYLLGAVDGTLSTIIFILLGAVGLPVFSGGAGGLAKLTGATGGYIIGYIFMALVAGFTMEAAKRKTIPTFLAFILGDAICYVIGTAWFVHLTGKTLAASMSLCVTPFIPGDLIKIALSIAIGMSVRKALMKASIME